MSDEGEHSKEVLEYECPECGATFAEGETNCPNCGLEFDWSEEAEYECPECGEPVQPHYEECPECGAMFLMDEEDEGALDEGEGAAEEEGVPEEDEGALDEGDALPDERGIPGRALPDFYDRTEEELLEEAVAESLQVPRYEDGEVGERVEVECPEEGDETEEAPEEEEASEVPGEEEELDFGGDLEEGPEEAVEGPPEVEQVPDATVVEAATAGPKLYPGGFTKLGVVFGLLSAISLVGVIVIAKWDQLVRGEATDMMGDRQRMAFIGGLLAFAFCMLVMIYDLFRTPKGMGAD